MDHRVEPHENHPEHASLGMEEGGAPAIDHWGLIWRRKWLLLLGLAAGLGAGFLKYTKDPAIFRSSARVQVVEPYARSIPVEGIDPRRAVSRSVYDETMVIRSEKVLTDAAMLGDLTHDELFNGKKPEVIGARLMGGVNIKPVGGGMDTSILEISYSCGNPGSSRKVVQSVIDAYAEHLRSQYDTVGKETRELIAEVKGEVSRKLEDLENRYDEFKKVSPLIYRDGERVSIHRENADKFLAEKQELLVRQARLDSKLLATNEAIEANEEWPAILLMLQETSNAVNEITEDARAPLASIEQAPIQMSRADTERERTLLPLQLREQEYLNQYGAGHPIVKDIQSQIAITQGLIQEIEKNERELQAELDKARSAALKLIESQGDGDEIANQVKLYLLAMQQQRKALIHEMQVIDNQYQLELRQAKQESAAEIKSAGFERDINRQQNLYNKFVARFDELDVMKGAEGLKVITLEQPKYGYQTAPSMSRSLGMGGTIGFLFILGLAYLLEWANRAYRSAEEIAQHLKLPVLGHIPITPGDSSTRKAKQALNSRLSPVLCSFFRNKSVHSEAYRAIRTALFFSNQGRGQQVLQVTSAVPADGKTTIAANIAISMAQMGKKVLLVDADMRRPQMGKLFGVDDDQDAAGLSWLLEQTAGGQVKSEMLDKTIIDTEVDNLSLVIAGERPDNPAELLASNAFDQVTDALRERFDIIIIDSPPLLAVTDPSNIAPRVDGVMLVIRLRKDARPLAAQATRMLETLDAKVIGVVINGVGSREAGEYGKYIRRDGYMNSGRYYQYGYGYTYGYSYGSDKRYGDYYRAGQRGKKNAPPPRLERNSATANGAGAAKPESEPPHPPVDTL